MFQDGLHGNKLLIVLAINGVCTVARTTSKSSGKSRSYGCHSYDRYPNFFIPSEAGIFNEDTWICLDYLVDFDGVAFAGKLVQRQVRKITELSRGLLIDLLNCAIDSDDVTAQQVERLKVSRQKLEAVK